MSAAIPLDLQAKMKKLRDKYLDEDSQQMLDQIEQALRNKIIKSKLKENDIVKEVIEDGLKRIEEINFLLAQDEELSEDERHRLFRERRVHRFWLARFGYEAETFIDSVHRFIDSRLSPEGDD